MKYNQRKRNISENNKKHFLIIECAKDLRGKFYCEVLADQYLEEKSYKQVVDSWDIQTLPEEWKDYDEKKKEIFKKYPHKILEYALMGWESDNEKIGALENLIQKEDKKPLFRIFVKLEKDEDFSFIDNKNAKLIYDMSKDPKYFSTKKNRMNSIQIAKDFTQKTGIEMNFRLVNIILNKYSKRE
jgi:hypothetical protein